MKEGAISSIRSAVLLFAFNCIFLQNELSTTCVIVIDTLDCHSIWFLNAPHRLSYPCTPLLLPPPFPHFVSKPPLIVDYSENLVYQEIKLKSSSYLNTKQCLYVHPNSSLL